MLLVGLLLGCSNDDDPDDATPTTQPPESQVEDAYLAYWEMGARLLEAPAPDDPEIRQRATGEALEDLVNGLTVLKESNQRYVLGARYGQTVTAVVVHGETATADVCVVDDAQLVDAATGEVVASGLTTSRWTVDLTRADGDWLVSRITEGEVQQGEVECD